MKSFYIHDGKQQTGPFTIEELIQIGVNKETPVWKTGLPNWTKAGDLDELASYFSNIPPAFTTSNNLQEAYSNNSASQSYISTTEKVGFRIGRFLGMTGLIVVLIIAGFFIYGQYMNRGSSPRNFATPFVDPEHSNPSTYLNATGTYHQNFWGNKIVINGSVTNNATHTNYKDIRIKVVFYSQTKSEVDSKEYVLYDYVPYASTKQFELRIDRPAAAATCGWEAISATPY